MKVLLYPEKTWAELGAVRFEVATELVKPGAMGKDEIDIDEDLQRVSVACLTHEEAVAKARKILERDDVAFGAVSIQKQVVDWFVREDRVAEWADVGDSEEICSGDIA